MLNKALVIICTLIAFYCMCVIEATEGSILIPSIVAIAALVVNCVAFVQTDWYEH